MLTSDRTHATLIILLALVVVFFACVTLIVYKERTVFARAGAYIVSLGNPAYVIQRDAIEAYLRNAQRIQYDFGARRISRNEALRRALALSVPSVLKERHLQWVTAVRAKRDAAAAVLIQEYSAVVPLEQ